MATKQEDLQEQLIRLLAEQQAQLAQLKLENEQLREGVTGVNQRLDNEEALRLAAEQKVSEENERQKKARAEAEQHRALEEQRQKEARAAALNILDAGGVSQLHRACWASDFPIINHLVREGADVNVKSSQGQTCLDAARAAQNWKVALMLQHYGGQGTTSRLPLTYEESVEKHPRYHKMKASQQKMIRDEHSSKHDEVAKLLKL